MDAFDQFVAHHTSDLKRIARATKGEQQYEDIVHEAWIMARNIAADDGVAIDYSDPAFLKVLLSHLYQHLVHYTERNVRHATRLDHSSHPDAGEDAPHPLIDRLVGDGGRDPLWYLQDSEDAPDPTLCSQHLHSLAGAYLALPNRLGNHMHAVAAHLLISLSYAYRCHARARWFAALQMPLRLPMADADFMLGPWRRARASRIPLQLAFDFEDELPFSIPQLDPTTSRPPVDFRKPDHSDHRCRCVQSDGSFGA